MFNTNLLGWSEDCHLWLKPFIILNPFNIIIYAGLKLSLSMYIFENVYDNL